MHSETRWFFFFLIFRQLDICLFITKAFSIFVVEEFKVVLALEWLKVSALTCSIQCSCSRSRSPVHGFFHSNWESDVGVIQLWEGASCLHWGRENGGLATPTSAFEDVGGCDSWCSKLNIDWPPEKQEGSRKRKLDGNYNSLQTSTVRCWGCGVNHSSHMFPAPIVLFF